MQLRMLVIYARPAGHSTKFHLLLRETTDVEEQPDHVLGWNNKRKTTNKLVTDDLFFSVGYGKPDIAEFIRAYNCSFSDYFWIASVGGKRSS